MNDYRLHISVFYHGFSEEQTLHRSSLVLGGDPSRAVLRASTGLYLIDHDQSTIRALINWGKLKFVMKIRVVVH